MNECRRSKVEQSAAQQRALEGKEATNNALDKIWGANLQSIWRDLRYYLFLVQSSGDVTLLFFIHLFRAHRWT